MNLSTVICHGDPLIGFSSYVINNDTTIIFTNKIQSLQSSDNFYYVDINPPPSDSTRLLNLVNDSDYHLKIVIKTSPDKYISLYSRWSLKLIYDNSKWYPISNKVSPILELIDPNVSSFADTSNSNIISDYIVDVETVHSSRFFLTSGGVVQGAVITNNTITWDSATATLGSSNRVAPDYSNIIVFDEEHILVAWIYDNLSNDGMLTFDIYEIDDTSITATELVELDVVDYSAFSLPPIYKYIVQMNQFAFVYVYRIKNGSDYTTYINGGYVSNNFTTITLGTPLQITSSTTSNYEIDALTKLNDDHVIFYHQDGSTGAKGFRIGVWDGANVTVGNLYQLSGTLSNRSIGVLSDNKVILFIDNDACIANINGTVISYEAKINIGFTVERCVVLNETEVIVYNTSNQWRTLVLKGNLITSGTLFSNSSLPISYFIGTTTKPIDDDTVIFAGSSTSTTGAVRAITVG